VAALSTIHDASQVEGLEAQSSHEISMVVSHATGRKIENKTMVELTLISKCITFWVIHYARVQFFLFTICSSEVKPHIINKIHREM
jgi:hypothetical protein